MEISEDTKLADILKINGAEEVLMKFNFPCLACPFARFEMEKLKIGEVCEMYGIDKEKLIKELKDKTKGD